MDSIVYFEGPGEFRAWLEQHHASADELWVGFHKTHTGLPSLTWPQSVDEALCYGWIDGLRKSLGPSAYKIRFTPRNPTSKWSAVNLKRVEELIAAGRMMPPGLDIWEKRRQDIAGYTYETPTRTLGEAELTEFMQNQNAWNYFQSQAPSYKKLAHGWVMNAKRAETRARRLQILIEDSEAGRRLGVTLPPKERGLQSA